jgi:hypothetical protein
MIALVSKAEIKKYVEQFLDMRTAPVRLCRGTCAYWRSARNEVVQLGFTHVVVPGCCSGNRVRAQFPPQAQVRTRTIPPLRAALEVLQWWRWPHWQGVKGAECHGATRSRFEEPRTFEGRNNRRRDPSAPGIALQFSKPHRVSGQHQTTATDIASRTTHLGKEK